MNLTRRTTLTTLTALVGITLTAGPVLAQGMDPESAKMEDDSMWTAVARNGSLYIFADEHYDTAGLDPDYDRCTPMRDDPALRALVGQAVADGHLLITEASKGLPILWTVTLKGRLYACEKTLEGGPDQVQALRRIAARWGWDHAQQPVNTRVARLILRQKNFLSASFGSSEPFIHREYAGALQAGLVYPTYANWSPGGGYMTFKPAVAALNGMALPNRHSLHRTNTAWGYTPAAPVFA